MVRRVPGEDCFGRGDVDLLNYTGDYILSLAIDKYEGGVVWSDLEFVKVETFALVREGSRATISDQPGCGVCDKRDSSHIGDDRVCLVEK